MPGDCWSSYREGFENYRSLEEDPEGVKALADLVQAGFVKEFHRWGDVLKYLDNMDPVTSKLVVVTNISDGVINHRWILDCRASGSNDAAVRQ